MDTKTLVTQAQGLIEASGQSAIATYVMYGVNTFSLFLYIAIGNLNLPVNDQKAKNFTKENVRAGKVYSIYNTFRIDENSDWPKDDKGKYFTILKAKEAGSKFAHMAEVFRTTASRDYEMSTTGRLKSKTVEGQKELVKKVKTPPSPQQTTATDDHTGSASMNDSLTKTEIQEKIQMVVDKYRANGAFTKAVESFCIDIVAQIDINRPE